jgi:hypothetical protein
MCYRLFSKVNGEERERAGKDVGASDEKAGGDEGKCIWFGVSVLEVDKVEMGPLMGEMKLETKTRDLGFGILREKKGNDFLYEWRRRIVLKPYVEDGSKLEEWKE